jgi:hypothetical protein
VSFSVHVAGDTELAKAVVAAYARTSAEKVEVARTVGDVAARRALKDVVRPPKVAGSLRKAGTLLILAPDPITFVPGVATVGASFLMKRREPAGLEDLVRETSRQMRELESLLPIANNS